VVRRHDVVVMSRLRVAVFAVLALALVACTKNTNVSAGGGTNYSQVPCADNCGGDAACEAQCTEVKNGNPPPPGTNIH
jgi:hypothetical protein